MSFLRSLFLGDKSGIDPVVARDCDRLIRAYGQGAADRAYVLSWQEDFGLMSAPKQGHWWRVRREIERRGRQSVPT